MRSGILEKLDVRTFWEKEDKNFTSWLAKEENIKLLCDTEGIDLEVQNQEESNGLYRSDLLCIDITNNHNVLIASHLEKS